MNGDDDIAAALPGAPFPAPARREAAITEALRRFDGAGARPAQAVDDRRPARPAPWWSRPARPYAGALAGAFLVALVGLPWVWTSFDDYPAGDKRPPGVEASRSKPAMADVESPPADIALPEGTGDPKAPAAAQDAEARDPSRPAQVRPSPAPGLLDPASPGRSEEPVAGAAAQEGGEIVVTGSRIRNPNLTSSSPVAAVGAEEIRLTDRRAARSARRGDWNECTIEDPGQNLERCRRSVGTVARGARGRAAAHLSDGLERAWTGDLEGATSAFDKAVELAPRSSAAYLNRGLAWRRRGDLDRALADLDRAVRYAPRDARAYYQRSLVLRQRGDLRRARSDEASAVALDHRYAPLVKGAPTR